jgi:hypothetical protein
VLTVIGVGLAVAGAVGTINLGPIGQIPTIVAFAIAAIGVALDVLAIVRQRRQGCRPPERPAQRADLATAAGSLRDRAGDASTPRPSAPRS